MRIRSQLVILVVATVAPLAVLTALATETLWELQRTAYQQLFLERVRALRLALDSELTATIRTLRALGDGASSAPDGVQFERVLANHPGWATVGVLDAGGVVRLRKDAFALPPASTLDAATREAVERTHRPAISNLVPVDERVYLTFVAVPVLHGGELAGIAYAGIEHKGWLELLKRYPIAQSATLTLNDRDGTIIARTLNDARWVGRQSLPSYWRNTIGEAEGVFSNAGLDGQPFYSAFSRSEIASWVLGTGVPRESVDAALRLPTLLLALGVTFAAALALLLAYVFGRRVATAMTSLAGAAKSVGGPEHATPTAPLAIDEAESVRRALEEAGGMLRAREQSLNEALDREARSRALAEHASQAKDQFLAMLGHELRNPLSAMSAAVAVIEASGNRGDVAEQARAVVQRQLRHLTEIVNDLLDVARLATGKIALNRRRLDLAELVRQVIDGFRNAGRCSHVTVETDLSPAIVDADETRMEQVVANLLDNACKYTPGGGRVSIRVAERGPDVELSVRDNGSGIAEELLPYVFDLFSQGDRTLDRSQGGLGLGLTVVRRLVEMHGGSAAVASDGPHRGSTFTVRLPRADDGASLEQAARPRTYSIASKRIAVVEDNVDIREFISALLRMKGHDVTVAQDGPGGVEAILSHRTEVALIDIGLPGFDGGEVARRVRANPIGRNVLLIALTGYGTPDDRARALAAGFDAFLVKPFDLAQFEQAVSSGRARVRSA